MFILRGLYETRYSLNASGPLVASIIPDIESGVRFIGSVRH